MRSGLLAGQDVDRPDGLADDVVDDTVERAVRAFQQRRGLLADGVVGPQTARALDAARWTLGDRFLLLTPGREMRGDDVAELQERLVGLGLLRDPVDGRFGIGTEAALRDFQRGVGLPVDGRCGAETLGALETLAGVTGARARDAGDPLALRQHAELAGAGGSLSGRVLVLDPAHGGDDPGATAEGLTEADVVHDLARRTALRLGRAGVVARLTRGREECPTDAERASTAARAGADVVLSLHCDSHPCPAASGIATFFWGDARLGSRSPLGHRLAALVQEELLARTGMVDCRTHPRTFEILRLTRMPAVRIELGYLSNPGDAARLREQGFRDIVADALVAAVRQLYRDARPGPSERIG